MSIAIVLPRLISHTFPGDAHLGWGYGSALVPTAGLIVWIRRLEVRAANILLVHGPGRPSDGSPSGHGAAWLLASRASSGGNGFRVEWRSEALTDEGRLVSGVARSTRTPRVLADGSVVLILSSQARAS